VNGKQYSNVIRISYEQYAMASKPPPGNNTLQKAWERLKVFHDMLGMQTTTDSTYLISSIIK